MNAPVRCAVVGYGPAFNWGWMHARWIQAVPDLQLVALCDRDPECAARAAADFPQVAVHTDLDELLARADVDLVAVVTPHNTHADLVCRCLAAGKHTVVEKPMCITVAEADTMIAAAAAAGRTLAVYHNRRHDGNVRAIKQLVDDGVLGEVFHIELVATGYSRDFTWGRPGEPWRASKQVSGGALYDWGAHAVDWLLSLVASPVAQVTGAVRKYRHEVTNEDHVHGVIRFENGCLAELMQSHLARISKPYLWYVLGTKGALWDTGQGAITGYCQELNGPSGGHLRLVTDEGEREVPYLASDWNTYYADLADHLLRGAPCPVSAADGRRVIGILRTIEASAASGHSEPVPYA